MASMAVLASLGMTVVGSAAHAASHPSKSVNIFDDTSSPAKRTALLESMAQQEGKMFVYSGTTGTALPKLIAGFGGRAAVTAQVEAALEENDPRWATELATWLVRSPEVTQTDRDLLARCLRTIGERTSSANIRNWCITRARHLDGSTDIGRLFGHRFTPYTLNGVASSLLIQTLRVLLDPLLAEGIDMHVGFVIDDEQMGLHVRNCVAVPTDGAGADAGGGQRDGQRHAEL